MASATAGIKIEWFNSQISGGGYATRKGKGKVLSFLLISGSGVCDGGF